MNVFSLAAVERDGLPTINARDLHAELGITTRFNDWIRRRIDTYDFREKHDYETILNSEYGHPGSFQPVDYALSIPMAKQLAMVEHNEKGREIRLHLIKIEEAWNTPGALMARALKVADKELKRLRPKAEAHDRYLSADGTLCLMDVGRVLGRPPKLLIDQMDRDKILFRGRGGKWEPFAHYRERGYFVVRVVTFGGHDAHMDGTVRQDIQTRVTSAGLDWLAKRYPKTDRPGSNSITKGAA